MSLKDKVALEKDITGCDGNCKGCTYPKWVEWSDVLAAVEKIKYLECENISTSTGKCIGSNCRSCRNINEVFLK